VTIRQFDEIYFYRAIHVVQCAVLLSFVVRPSVCLSVCNVDVPWTYVLGQFESNYTSNHLMVFGSSEPQHRQSSPWETPQNSGGIGEGSLFSAENMQYISETGQDRTKVTIDLYDYRKSEVSYALLFGAKINDLGWYGRTVSHSVSKHMRPSEPITKISMKIDPCYRQQRCNATSLVSGNIKFMRIFAGVPWRGGVKRGNRERGFLGLSRTLRLRHFRKWGPTLLRSII